MKKKLREKYLNEIDKYRNKQIEYIMPGGGGEDPKYPFKKFPKELSDDYDFILHCIEIDNGESFKLASNRLKNNKNFVLDALEFVNTKYEDLNSNLQKDMDIIKKAQANDFKLFGKKIINDKDKIYEIFENSNNKEFKSYKLIPNRIRSDVNFFLKLLTIKNQSSQQLVCSGRCLLWATNKVINNKKIINTALKREPSSLKYLGKKTKEDKKILDYVLKKAGFLPDEIEKKLLKKKSFVLKKIKYDTGHVYEELDNKFKNDKDIAFAAVKINPNKNYQLLPIKFKDDLKFMTKLINSLKMDDFQIFEDIYEDLKKFENNRNYKKILIKIKNLISKI